MKWLMCRNCII